MLKEVVYIVVGYFI